MPKNKKKKNRAFHGAKPGRCPYCGSTLILRSADGIYRENVNNTKLYVCSKYPACDAYVRVIPGTDIPLGSPANGALRALRLEAHRYFDRLHQSGLMSKNDAYQWLADILQAPLSQAHIGYLGEYYCRRVIEESRQMLDNRRRIRTGQPAVYGKIAMGV